MSTNVQYYKMFSKISSNVRNVHKISSKLPKCPKILKKSQKKTIDILKYFKMSSNFSSIIKNRNYFWPSKSNRVVKNLGWNWKLTLRQHDYLRRAESFDANYQTSAKKTWLQTVWRWKRNQRTGRLRPVLRNVRQWQGQKFGSSGRKWQASRSEKWNFFWTLN